MGARQSQLNLQEVICAPYRESCSPSSHWHLKPLLAWIPEAYRLHQRMVDTEGYVLGELYSLLGSGLLDQRRVEIFLARRETGSRSNSTRAISHYMTGVPLDAGCRSASRCLNTDRRAVCGREKRSDPRIRKNWRSSKAGTLRSLPYISALKQKGRKVVALALRQLLRLSAGVSARIVPHRGCRSRPAMAFTISIVWSGMILRCVARGSIFMIGEQGSRKALSTEELGTAAEESSNCAAC